MRTRKPGGLLSESRRRGDALRWAVTRFEMSEDEEDQEVQNSSAKKGSKGKKRDDYDSDEDVSAPSLCLSVIVRLQGGSEICEQVRRGGGQLCVAV